MSNQVSTTRQRTEGFRWEIGNKHFEATTIYLIPPPHWGMGGAVEPPTVGVGDPYLLTLMAELGDDGLNGTFTLSQDPSNKEQPVLFVHTKTADGNRLDFATGDVALRIRPDGFGTGNIFAELNGIKLLGDFSFDDTATSRNVTVKKVDDVKAFLRRLSH